MAWDAFARWLLCPHCKSSFNNEGRSLRCARGHTFDIARPGYLNLLAAGGGKRPGGDTAEMVAARRRFLDRGLYQPISNAINASALRCLADTLHLSGDIAAPIVADAGCGEGYYLGRLRDAMTSSPAPSDFILSGFDSSREAIRAAAQRQASCAWMVADTRGQLPYRDDSVSLLINTFAPRNAAEFARVIAPGGHLMVVIPTQRHLGELRAVVPLLGIEMGKAEHVRQMFSSAFSFRPSMPIEFPIALDRSALADLLCMTPNRWHIGDDVRATLTQVDHLQVLVSCELLVFRRTEGSVPGITAATARALPPGRRPRRARRRRAS